MTASYTGAKGNGADQQDQRGANPGTPVFMKLRLIPVLSALALLVPGRRGVRRGHVRGRQRRLGLRAPEAAELGDRHALPRRAERRRRRAHGRPGGVAGGLGLRLRLRRVPGLRLGRRQLPAQDQRTVGKRCSTDAATRDPTPDQLFSDYSDPATPNGRNYHTVACASPGAYGNYRAGTFSNKYGDLPANHAVDWRYTTKDEAGVLVKDTSNGVGAPAWFFVRADCVAPGNPTPAPTPPAARADAAHPRRRPHRRLLLRLLLRPRRATRSAGRRAAAPIASTSAAAAEPTTTTAPAAGARSTEGRRREDPRRRPRHPRRVPRRRGRRARKRQLHPSTPPSATRRPRSARATSSATPARRRRSTSSAARRGWSTATSGATSATAAGSTSRT